MPWYDQTKGYAHRQFMGDRSILQPPELRLTTFSNAAMWSDAFQPLRRETTESAPTSRAKVKPRWDRYLWTKSNRVDELLIVSYSHAPNWERECNEWRICRVVFLNYWQSFENCVSWRVDELMNRNYSEFITGSFLKLLETPNQEEVSKKRRRYHN
jgi:hypothetical protein